jgi:hypothetical protein
VEEELAQPLPLSGDPAREDRRDAFLAVWAYVWAIVIACRFAHLSTASSLSGGGFATTLERLALERDWMLLLGPPDGASPRVAGPRTMAALYAARVPISFAPTLAAIFFARVAWSKSGRRTALVLTLAFAVLAITFPVHVFVADRMPPFTYKYPGWNGTKQVMRYVVGASSSGSPGSPRSQRWQLELPRSGRGGGRVVATSRAIRSEPGPGLPPRAARGTSSEARGPRAS